MCTPLTHNKCSDYLILQFIKIAEERVLQTQGH